MREDRLKPWLDFTDELLKNNQEKIMSTTPKKPHKHAEFDPDFQEVKAGENYRWMGHTAREWQEQYASMSKLAEDRGAGLANYAKSLGRASRALLRAGFEDRGGEEWAPPVGKAPDWVGIGKRDAAVARAEELMAERDQQLEHAQRVLEANGFTYSPDEGWSIHSANASDQVRDAVASVGEYKEKAAAMERLAEFHATEANKFQRQLREAEDKHDLNLFGARVGRAVGDFLGVDREQLTYDQIAAIVLLERAK